MSGLFELGLLLVIGYVVVTLFGRVKELEAELANANARAIRAGQEIASLAANHHEHSKQMNEDTVELAQSHRELSGEYARTIRGWEDRLDRM